MDSDIRRDFDVYWTDRIPGMIESARFILNNDTEFNHTLRLMLRDVSINNKVIDMGTGVGTVALEMARMGFEVHAIDRVPEVIEAARGLAQEMALDVDFMVGDAETPDLPKKSFDIVVARNSLWNLEDPMRAVSEWTSLLRPGG
jgi:2-polyprenyl-3-methyl-5-hydroxy-6-metoxy-1,4-benzoquinol methylase